MNDPRLDAIEWLLSWTIANVRNHQALAEDTDIGFIAGMEKSAPAPQLAHIHRIIENARRLQMGLPMAPTPKNGES